MNAWKSIDSIEELKRQFPSEESCFPFLYHLKWPNGFRCPQCQHQHAFVISTRRLPLYECCACRRQTSLIAHTIMEYSRTPLHKWLLGIWLVSRSEYKMNALIFRNFLQVTYKTAWLMFHKIRSTIHNYDNDVPLAGIVQGIVSYHGQPLGRSVLDLFPQENPLIVASSVSEENEIERVKMKLVDRSHAIGLKLRPAAIEHFVDQQVCPFTDEHLITINPLPFRILAFTRRLKECFRAAKYRIIDTYRGVGRKYLQLYLDEYCYRLNVDLENTDSWQTLIFNGMNRYNRQTSFLKYRFHHSYTCNQLAA